MLGGVIMRKAQIYIRKHKKHEKNEIIGGCCLPTGGSLPP